jgi:transcription initiation factor TFIIE subunit alpha
MDFSEVRNVIKYKIYKMSRMIEREIKQSEELQGYACLSCGKEFSVLDAQSLIQDYVFKCDECMGELVENRAKKVAGDPRDLHSSMMNDIKEIVELLKEVDKYDIPSVDYFQVLKMRKVKEEGDGGKSALVKETIEEEKEEELIEDITIELPSTVNIVEEGKNEKKKIDEMVLVSGMQKSFSEVTEEDQEKMSEAEYEKYYEIYSKYNQE